MLAEDIDTKALFGAGNVSEYCMSSRQLLAPITLTKVIKSPPRTTYYLVPSTHPTNMYRRRYATNMVTNHQLRTLQHLSLWLTVV